MGGATFVGNGYPTNKSQVYVSNWFTDAFPDYRFLSLSIFFPHTKNDLTTMFRNQKVQCSMEIVFHLIMIMVMLSCQVMSCYVTLPTRSYLARSGFYTNNSSIQTRTPHFL